MKGFIRGKGMAPGLDNVQHAWNLHIIRHEDGGRGLVEVRGGGEDKFSGAAKSDAVAAGGHGGPVSEGDGFIWLEESAWGVVSHEGYDGDAGTAVAMQGRG